MNTPGSTVNGAGFSMFRLCKAKQAVDIAETTLREFAKKPVPGFPSGLPLYKLEKAVFVSKAELEQYIRAASLMYSFQILNKRS